MCEVTAARACASADALVFGDVAVWSAVDAVWEGVSSTDVDFADQRTLEHFLVALHPRFRPRVLLERCVDWDNHRGAAIVCQLQGEFAEELRCQFAHLGTAFPVPPAERSDAQQRRVVATAIDLASMYADNATSESQRTSLIGNVRGCAASGVARMVTSLAARYGGLLVSLAVVCVLGRPTVAGGASVTAHSVQGYGTWVGCRRGHVRRAANGWRQHPQQ